jgi:hypothetical protein
MILNFKICKKALSKLFLKDFIYFFLKLSLHAQNDVWIWVLHPIFAAALCGNREYLGGGRVWVSSFLNSLHALIRSAPLGACPISPQLWGEVFSPGGRGPKSPILSGLIRPDAARCEHSQQPHWKGLNGSCKTDKSLTKIKWNITRLRPKSRELWNK